MSPFRIATTLWRASTLIGNGWASEFELVVSGSLTNKLDPKTRIVVARRDRRGPSVAINLALNAPTPSIRTILDWRQFSYAAHLTKRMRYEKFPYWDPSTERLAPIPEAPRYRVKNLSTGQELASEPLGLGAMQDATASSKRHGYSDEPAKSPRNGKLIPRN